MEKVTINKKVAHGILLRILVVLEIYQDSRKALRFQLGSKVHSKI